MSVRQLSAAMLTAWVVMSWRGSASGAIIADFAADYQTVTPKVGWLYEWNNRGAIGDPANYTPLAWDPFPARPHYDIDGAATISYPAPGPGGFIIVEQGHLHPGQGSNQVAIPLYVIASYTLTSGGEVSIKDLSVSDRDYEPNQPLDDGISVFVNVNGDPVALVATIARGGSFTLSNLQLGTRNANDTIYVAIGARTTNQTDDTNLSYQIDLVPEPGSLGLIGFGATAMLARRRRR
jgi:hypothetical protein